MLISIFADNEEGNKRDRVESLWTPDGVGVRGFGRVWRRDAATFHFVQGRLPAGCRRYPEVQSLDYSTSFNRAALPRSSRR